MPREDEVPSTPRCLEEITGTENRNDPKALRDSGGSLYLNLGVAVGTPCPEFSRKFSAGRRAHEGMGATWMRWCHRGETLRNLRGEF